MEASVPLDRYWPPFSEILKHHPPKVNRLARRRIWRYRLQAGVWNCQILNQVVESQLFTSLWNKYHQWFSDFELIRIRAFSASYSWVNPCFTAGKRIVVWNCHTTCGHQRTTIFTSILVYGNNRRNIKESCILNIHSNLIFAFRLHVLSWKKKKDIEPWVVMDGAHNKGLVSRRRTWRQYKTYLCALTKLYVLIRVSLCFHLVSFQASSNGPYKHRFSFFVSYMTPTHLHMAANVALICMYSTYLSLEKNKVGFVKQRRFLFIQRGPVKLWLSPTLTVVKNFCTFYGEMMNGPPRIGR